MVPPKGAEVAHAQEMHGLQQIFGSMNVGETLTDYQKRPGLGSAGKRIKVAANMYQARFKDQGRETNSVIHYDVEINPIVKVANQKKPRTLLNAIWKQMTADITGEAKRSCLEGAFDGQKNMYTPYPLPVKAGESFEFIVALRDSDSDGTDDRRRFKVVMTQANVIDLNTITNFCMGERQTKAASETMLVAIQAMNILFRQDPTERFRAVGAQGRRFFGTNDASSLPQAGMVYNGFMQSFRFTSSGLPAMQLDTAYSAFVQSGPLLEVIAAMIAPPARGRGGPPRGGGAGMLNEIPRNSLKRLNEVLRMAKFNVSHRQSSRVYTMRGLTTQPASEIRFFLNARDGGQERMVSVVDYLKEQYGYTVRKPRLPCVQYGNKNYLPVECVILQEFNSIPMRYLTSDQTAEMIKVAAKPPPQRLAMINNWRSTLNYSNLPKVKAWGVEVQSNMMQVEARVLPTPLVNYEGTRTMQARFGSWNLKGIRFAKAGVPLKSWGVISFDQRTDEGAMRRFLTQLVNVLKNSGCPVANERPILKEVDPDRPSPLAGIKPAMQTMAREIFQANKSNPQLIVIILPRKDTMLYSTIKQISYEGLLLPIATQCLQAAKINSDRGLDQYLGNVSMKIHAKLGGVTHFVANSGLDRQTMMVGADVTHPPARHGGPLPPSIAVSVAATNGSNNHFVAACRLQEGRVEIIQDLENMMHSHLNRFQKSMKTLPQKIIMFRDGVSEGQYGHCVQQELPRIKAAAARFPNYKPKITFVVCAKRHNMRFFALADADKDRSGNLPAGTVVDTGVTHPFAFDFFLQAHAGLQGTAKPTHYICVTDENGYTADKLQTLCNNLCYSYLRATRSVSIVPVAYYADIIAGRLRECVYAEDTADTATLMSSDSGRSRDRQEFDPLRFKKRFEDTVKDPSSFNEVAWFM